ncbi:MAG: hypothetical protein CEO12_528 [Parcubacteria group bacterium Gr01-1014_46]|nr:MAG: hypothetical protein CEO12_528 [Parcubacteria group bacterium Gr01-1014_46]
MRKEYLVILIIFFVLFFGIVYFSSKEQSASLENITATSIKPKTEEKRVTPTGMHEYISDAYSFSVFYPEELKVDERSEGEGATTITFQNIKDGKGFQIFILPYFNSQVSESRFRKDIPSGVRTGIVDFEIGGAVGASFYSKDLVLGDTYEIWFVKNNFLYEVTTLKNLNVWLDDIMKNWKFL